MTKLSRSAWLASMVAVIKANANGEITGVQLQDRLEDLADSVTFIDSDSELLGLRAHNPSFPYKNGQTAISAGLIYQAKEDVQGAFDPAKWLLIGVSFDYGYPDYENDEEYVTGNKVTFELRLFKVISVTPIQGIPPLDDDGLVNEEWEEVSAQNTLVLKPWSAGAYKRDSVVRYDGQILYLDEDDGFESEDIDMEIIAGSWITLFTEVTKFVMKSTPGNYRYLFICNDSGQMESSPL